jgi:putative transposase
MSTYLGLHYHLIFSTKEREPSIVPSLRPRLHEYLGGLVRGLEGQAQGIGGTSDHVHLLVSLKATHRLSDFMRELKKSSSLWMHQEGEQKRFSWQEGYCALTVSPSGRRGVRDYIANQETHHRVRGFREELVEFLNKAGVPYEESYLK